MPGPIPRPSDFFLRNSHYKRGLIFIYTSVPVSIAAAYSFWHFYAVPKQRKYVEFYRDYDPYKHYQEICNYPTKYMRSCPDTQRYLLTKEMREDGKTDEEIEEYFAKVAAAPNYEDILDEIKEEDIPREKIEKPPHIFFLSWFVPWYQTVEQIPREKA